MAPKYANEYKISAPKSNVKLKDGRFLKAFNNNIEFLKAFDIDRILYPYRVNAGKPAPKVPYCWQSGHFERNLKGQTAGEFLMGAATTLLWQEDTELRDMVDRIVKEVGECGREDGLLLPITDEEWHTKEYPNYTRAWLTFGLLDAGYAGNKQAFELARKFTDYFNHCDLLPYVKDMNLGFQGILVNTRVYDSPVGKREDIEVNEEYYAEDWWLKQLIAGDHKAIYAHPGNHPHSTLLTALEGYLDLYRATGKKLYLDAVKAALPMYESKWQHVGGGINMCEFDNYYPGCNWLGMKHSYNELCSTNFWVLLNQRMRLLEPMNSHYADEIENSIYNVLFAAQVGSQGFHYLNFLEGGKDSRYLDRCTCCASLGTRLVGLLPSLIYTYDENGVYVDLYASSEAKLPCGTIECETDMPDGGNVRIKITESAKPFALRVRIPRWVNGRVEIFKNGQSSGKASSGYFTLSEVSAGDVITFTLPMSFKVTKYTGAEEIIGKDRYALEYGPLLYAALGPATVEVKWDVNAPENEFVAQPGSKRIFTMHGDNAHEYMAYADITDEPFSVYPVVLK